MKRLLLLLLTACYMPAFVPSPAASKSGGLPTFGQMVKKEEERQQQISKLLENLPAELRREILHKIKEYGTALNVDALAKTILNFAGTNKALRAQINNLPNILTLLNALPGSAALYLVEKLAKLPVIQNNMLEILQLFPKSGAVYLSEVLATTPGMMQNDVQSWLKNIKLRNGPELYEAMTAENPDFPTIIKLLEGTDTDINWGDEYGYTALMKASIKGYSEIVERLIAAGVNVHAKKKDGETALHLAAINGRMEIIKLLLKAGANVNLKDKFGNTALMEASESGYDQIVRILLEAGADPSIQNRAGDSAQSLAYSMMYKIPERRAEYIELRKMLRDAEKAQQKRLGISNY